MIRTWHWLIQSALISTLGVLHFIWVLKWEGLASEPAQLASARTYLSPAALMLIPDRCDYNSRFSWVLSAPSLCSMRKLWQALNAECAALITVLKCDLFSAHPFTVWCGSWIDGARRWNACDCTVNAFLPPAEIWLDMDVTFYCH